MDRRKVDRRGMCKDKRIKERRSMKKRRQVNSQKYGNRIDDVAQNRFDFLGKPYPWGSRYGLVKRDNL